MSGGPARLVVAALLLAVTACQGFIEGRAADSTYRILTSASVAARRQVDVDLARDALPGGIVQLEAFALAYPHHAGFRALHAESLCQYAVAFVFDEWEDAQLVGRAEDAVRAKARVAGLVDACVEANLRLLPAPWRQARAQDGAAWAEQVAAATDRQVPQLLWIAMADAVELAIDPLRHLGKLDAITAALERCIAIRPGFHDSDAELLLGTIEAGRSRFLGGADGSERFARARAQLGEGALLVDVMFARATLVARGDRAGFVATLEHALAADLARWPERRLANALAQRKAARYLAAIDQLFPPPP